MVEDSLCDMLHDTLAGGLPLGRSLRPELVRVQGGDIIAQQGADLVRLGHHVGVVPQQDGGSLRPIGGAGTSLQCHTQLRVAVGLRAESPTPSADMLSGASLGCLHPQSYQHHFESLSCASCQAGNGEPLPHMTCANDSS